MCRRGICRNPAGFGPLQTRNAVMVDDRPEDTGPSAESVRPKRAGPTIDLEATEVSGDVRNAAAGAAPEPDTRAAPGIGDVPGDYRGVRRRRHRRAVLGVAWFLGWNAASPLPAPPADTAAIDGLAARIASVESKTNAPPPLRRPPCPMRRRPRASKRWRNRPLRCAPNWPPRARSRRSSPPSSMR